jgi:hypothetical protein
VKKLIFILFVALFGYKQMFAGKIKNLYAQKKSDVQVMDKGVVVKILSDDNIGSRHQKFILKLDSGITVMITHNIDLAKRINSLSIGDEVEFYGEYEYNSKGGVVHWTHHDPKKYHKNGWLKHNGVTYQ